MSTVIDALRIDLERKAHTICTCVQKMCYEVRKEDIDTLLRELHTFKSLIETTNISGGTQIVHQLEGLYSENVLWADNKNDLFNLTYDIVQALLEDNHETYTTQLDIFELYDSLEKEVAFKYKCIFDFSEQSVSKDIIEYKIKAYVSSFVFEVLEECWHDEVYMVFTSDLTKKEIGCKLDEISGLIGYKLIDQTYFYLEEEDISINPIDYRSMLNELKHLCDVSSEPEILKFYKKFKNMSEITINALFSDIATRCKNLPYTLTVNAGSLDRVSVHHKTFIVNELMTYLNEKSGPMILYWDETNRSINVVSDLTNKFINGKILQTRDYIAASVGKKILRQNTYRVTEFDIGLQINVPSMLSDIVSTLLVRIGQMKFTIPIDKIERTYQARASELISNLSGDFVSSKDKCIPVIKLFETYHITSDFTRICDGIVIEVKTEDESFALLVDEILDQVDVTFQYLPHYMSKQVKGVVACSVLREGDIALALDLQAIKGVFTMEVM